MPRYEIAVIAGDGIGREVIPAGMDVLDVAADVVGNCELKWQRFDWGCDYYLRTGRMMPDSGLTTLAQFDAIYLGAIGTPGVPDHVSLWGLLLPIRQHFQQYVNLRPVRLLPGIPGPLRNKGSDDINFVCVRENTEGEYSGAGGRVHRGHPEEVVVQTAIFTRKGTERIIRYTFEYARRHGRSRVASATKSNAINHSMVFWDEVFEQVASEYPDITAERYHVDALAARFITHPESLDVVVGSNLFGDILTDLGGALQGSLGVPASANLNPEGRYPSMFEPVHGSAPDIAGKGIANPIASIWAGAMMLEHLGQRDASDLVMRALERATAEGRTLTPDLGGQSTTEEFTRTVIGNLRSL
ncbi:MAG: tartrate dehydrogenase [Anaerolineae bacterium]|nr:tartrate dehydrogenase [Anaerolineae bacterium]